MRDEITLGMERHDGGDCRGTACFAGYGTRSSDSSTFCAERQRKSAPPPCILPFLDSSCVVSSHSPANGWRRGMSDEDLVFLRDFLSSLPLSSNTDCMGGPPRCRGVGVLAIQQLRIRRPTYSSWWCPKFPFTICVVVSNGYQQVKTQKGHGVYTAPTDGGAAAISSEVAPNSEKQNMKKPPPISSRTNIDEREKKRQRFSTDIIMWSETIQLGLEQPTDPISISVFSCSSSTCCRCLHR